MEAVLPGVMASDPDLAREAQQEVPARAAYKPVVEEQPQAVEVEAAEVAEQEDHTIALPPTALPERPEEKGVMLPPLQEELQEEPVVPEQALGQHWAMHN